MKYKICEYCRKEIFGEFEKGYITYYKFGSEISKERINSKSKRVDYHLICAKIQYGN